MANVIEQRTRFKLAFCNAVSVTTTFDMLQKSLQHVIKTTVYQKKEHFSSIKMFRCRESVVDQSHSGRLSISINCQQDQ